MWGPTITNPCAPNKGTPSTNYVAEREARRQREKKKREEIYMGRRFHEKGGGGRLERDRGIELTAGALVAIMWGWLLAKGSQDRHRHLSALAYDTD